MRIAMRVAWREAVERRVVLAGAVLVALLVVVAPWLPWSSGWPAADVRSVAGVVLAAAFAVVVSVGLGFSMLGTDLVEGRLGFFLSRPISASALWFGTLGGAWALTVAATAVVLLPAIVQPGFAGRVDLPWGALALGWLVVPLPLVALAHAIGVMWRDPSRRLVADVVAAAPILAVTVIVARRLVAALAVPAMLRAGVGVAVALVVAACVAGAVGLGRGRTSLVATHRNLSATLWGILGATALVLAGYAAWVLAAGPRDLTRMTELTAAPAGPWVAVDGEARPRGLLWAGFLVDTSSGRFVRLGARTGAQPGSIAFSADGRRATFLSLSGGGAGRTELFTVDLTAREPRPTATGIFVEPGKQSTLIPSDDGGRVGVVAGGSVAVYELDSARQVGAARLPEGVARVYGYFGGGELCLDLVVPHPVRRERGANEVRVGLELYRFDPVARKLVRTGSTGDLGEDPVILPALSPDRRTLLVTCRTGGERSVTLHDARTGTRVATLVDRPTGWGTIARFLADGRIVVGRLAGNRVGLELFSSLGVSLGRLDLGEGAGLQLGVEAAPDRVLVAVLRDEVGGNPRTQLVDVDRGTSVGIAEGWTWVWWPWFTGDLGQAPAPGSPASRLLVRWSGDEAFALLDPQTGELQGVPGLPGPQRPVG